MDNEALFDQFIQDFLQVNTNTVKLQIFVFIYSVWVLITTMDESIDTFLSEIHSQKSARTAASSIIIVPTVSTSLNVVRFGLKDRNMCNALPDEANLNEINISQINTLQSKHYEEKLNASHWLNQQPPVMVVLDLKVSTFEQFEPAFQWASRRFVEINMIPLDYVHRYNEVSNYDTYWYSIKLLAAY